MSSSPAILEGSISPKHRDQKKREKVPTRADLATKYHPVNDWLMIIPIEGLSESGGIIIPSQARREMHEGHIVELGPLVNQDHWHVGDCVTWEPNSELRMKLDESSQFVIIRPGNILMRIPAAELN